MASLNPRIDDRAGSSALRTKGHLNLAAWRRRLDRGWPLGATALAPGLASGAAVICLHRRILIAIAAVLALAVLMIRRPYLGLIGYVGILARGEHCRRTMKTTPTTGTGTPEGWLSSPGLVSLTLSTYTSGKWRISALD